MRNSAGSSVLGMILMVLTFSLAVMNFTQQQLREGISILGEQQRYSRSFYRLRSTLNWALTLRWPNHPGWQCQNEPQFQLTGCLFSGEKQNGWLRSADPDSGLVQWQRVDINGNTLLASPQGWIDFCPFARDTLCQPTGRF